jgi:D-arabinitol 4-dehydrogenase
MPSSTELPLVILHLGLGSFHRAHQAVYLHQLRESGDTRWVLAGGNIRADMADTIAALRQQGGAYTLETITPAQERTYTRIESIKTIVPFEPALAGLIALGADGNTRIISFTVTEAGYYLDPSYTLDPNLSDVQADIAAVKSGQPGTTIYGVLSAILRARMTLAGGPVTLMNCDNLRHNGERSRAALLQFLALVGDENLLTWVKTNTTSPNAMVDRITPRPTPDVAARVKAATGRDDPAAVMGESFIQWVLEENFANGRPNWETVGVEMVKSVTAHEEAKIRLLNATHSCIAWAGTLAGLSYIDEGARDPVIRQFAIDYVTDDAIPLLLPSTIDLERYRDIVMDRFGNPALKDTNQRVAMDAYSKIPAMIAPTIRERLKRGESIRSVAMLPALFLAYLQRWHSGKIPYSYQDQAMDVPAAHAMCESADPVVAFAADAALWGDMARDPRLVDALRGAFLRVKKFEQERA